LTQHINAGPGKACPGMPDLPQESGKAEAL